jgi:hypothetical protein
VFVKVPGIILYLKHIKANPLTVLLLVAALVSYHMSVSSPCFCVLAGTRVV